MALSAVRGLLLCAAFVLFAKPQLAERRPELQDSDLVIVMGSCGSRLDLAHSTARAGRGSSLLRTVVVVENDTLAQQLNRHFGKSHNETYLSWPDRPDPRKPGDSRVAMVPWLAHRALGETYKWFLYGDDDTYFFVPNVKELLRDYDPDLPYVISDVLWHNKKRYLSEAPRCLPCHTSAAFREYAATRADRDVVKGRPPMTWYAPPVPPNGCPCTPELACEYTLNVTGKRKLLARDSPVKWSPESKAWGLPQGYPSKCDYPHFHGGSGVLVSVGAMRKVSFEDALKCYYDDIKKLTALPGTLKADAHGDRMTSLCFWMHGIATTDPGLSVSRAELSYVGGRVMDSRTTGLEVLRGVVQEDMPGAWLWSILYMAASHIGHKDKASERPWAYRELFPQARQRAVQQLQEAGQLGRGDLDALVGTWVPEGYDRVEPVYATHVGAKGKKGAKGGTRRRRGRSLAGEGEGKGGGVLEGLWGWWARGRGSTGGVQGGGRLGVGSRAEAAGGGLGAVVDKEAERVDHGAGIHSMRRRLEQWLGWLRNLFHRQHW